VCDQAHHCGQLGERRERTIRADGHVRELSGSVAADASAIHNVAGKIEVFRDDGQQHRATDPLAIGNLLGSSACYGDRAGHARNRKSAQHVVAEEPLHPKNFIVTPPRIPGQLRDDIRSYVIEKIRAGEETAARARIVEIDDDPIHERTAIKGASKAQGQTGCASTNRWRQELQRRCRPKMPG
jgi:hypothetical protein